MPTSNGLIDENFSGRTAWFGRYSSIDIARGIIMILMALDHASAAWNSGRPRPEGLAGMPPVEYGSVAQQITREITHICAPGFQFLAGMGLAISVFRRRVGNVPGWLISGDMLLRGLVLCFCDFVLMYYVYDQVPFFFLVLACIGSCIIIFSVVRLLPLCIIAGLSVLVILAAPIYFQGGPVAPSAEGYFINILFNTAMPTDFPVPEGQWGFWVMYPIFPWIGCFGLGWCLGTLYEKSGGRAGSDPINERTGRVAVPNRLVVVGIVALAAAFLLRWFGGAYADRLPVGDGPISSAFWAISKYPPSPVFLISTIGAMLVLLGVLRPLDASERVGWAWRVPLVFGHVSLFFYIVHFYLYGIYPFFSDTISRYSLKTVYTIWLAGLVIMFPLCLGYKKLRSRHRRILRYF